MLRFACIYLDPEILYYLKVYLTIFNFEDLASTLYFGDFVVMFVYAQLHIVMAALGLWA